MDVNSIRQLVSSGLAGDGPSSRGRLAADPMTSMVRPRGELPGGALLVAFETFPHTSASFYVGIVGSQVFGLTLDPAAFSAMLRASGLQVGAPEVAITVARAYVETTRSMQEFTRVVDGSNDLAWPAPKTPEHEQALASVIDRLRTLIRPPIAEAAGDGYKITLYVLRGSVLERRALTISRDGNVGEQVELVESGLPAPISI